MEYVGSVLGHRMSTRLLASDGHLLRDQGSQGKGCRDGGGRFIPEDGTSSYSRYLLTQRRLTEEEAQRLMTRAEPLSKMD